MTNTTVQNIQSILSFYNLDCWIMFTDEGSDPYFKKYISDKLISTSLFVVTKNSAFIIANSLDFDNVERHENVQNICYRSEEGQTLKDQLKTVIQKIDFPANISLSYSTIHDVLVDVLGHGSYLYITDLIGRIYEEAGKPVGFTSAEKVIYGLTDRKDKTAVEKMTLAARRADEILKKAFQQIKPGMTEKEVVELVHEIFKEKPPYFKEFSVINEEFSWNKDFCPVVLTGPSLQKGGHAMSSEQVIYPGYTIYFDFGVKLFFEDQSYFSSDIQRMGYVLKDGEQSAPEDIVRIFKTLYDSVTLGIDNLQPGKKGYEIDEIVRGYITDAGYIDYDHATGHAIGEIAHSPGTLLGPKGRGLSLLDIQPNGVYTIEPRIPVNNGGSIEEMVLATPEGGVSISPRQTELYIIQSSANSSE